MLFATTLAITLPLPMVPPSDRAPAVPPAASLAITLPAGAASRRDPSSLPAARVPASGVEACASGSSPVEPTDSGTSLPIPEGARSSALQRLALTMAASRDERVRAAERLLSIRLAIDTDALASAVQADATCRQARDMGLEETTRFCVDEQTRAQAALLEPATAAIDQLARMAVLSNDPVIYAFAFEACDPQGLNFHGREGNCQLVNAEQWSRVAPDDAAPWLAQANAASARGDASGATAALDRAARATTMGTSSAALPALALGALPDGMTGPERTAVLTEFEARADVEVDAVPAGLAAIDTACAEPVEREPARRSLCNGLATMLVERSHSVAAVGAGIQLGERLGWPAERIGPLSTAHRQALRDGGFRPAAPATPCAPARS